LSGIYGGCGNRGNDTHENAKNDHENGNGGNGGDRGECGNRGNDDGEYHPNLDEIPPPDFQPDFYDWNRHDAGDGDS
jgi:hypothetical protein